MGKCTDLVGRKFGRLLVIERAENYISPKGKKESRWKCVCSCKNKTEIIVKRSCLIHGYTQSCGCLQKEKAGEYCKKNKKSYNDYEVQEDYVIMYTSKGEPFLVDLDDFWKVRDICWHKNHKGYLVGCGENGKELRLHRLVTNCPDGLMPDHKGGVETRYDNRKNNLRIATNEENCHNQKIRKNNSSGVTGVYWHKKTQKWQASICVSGNTIYLGLYNSFSDAVDARKRAEKEYYKEWAYDNSQIEYKMGL